jgi:hypothetical protein
MGMSSFFLPADEGGHTGDVQTMEGRIVKKVVKSVCLQTYPKIRVWKSVFLTMEPLLFCEIDIS